MDARYPVDREIDVIFCRNILIYFDKPTQQAVLERLCRHLRPGGYLFLGHSESLAGFGLPLRRGRQLRLPPRRGSMHERENPRPDRR